MTLVKPTQPNFDEALIYTVYQIVSGFLNTEIEEFDDQLNQGLKLLGEYLDADRTYLFKYDFDKNTCSNTHEWCQIGIEPMIDLLQESPLDDIELWVEDHKEGRDIYVEDVQALPLSNGVREILEPQGVLSLLAVPLFDNGTCIGFLGLDSVRQKRRYSDSERYVLHEFAKSLLFLLRKVKMERELLETKNKLQTVMDQQKDLIIQYTPEGKVIFENKAFKNFKQLQKTCVKSIPGESETDQYTAFLESLQNHTENAIAGNYLETNITCCDGQNIWLRWDIQVVQNSNGSVVYQGIGVDITELKNAQMGLELEKNKLKYTIKAADMGTWEWDIKNNELTSDELYYSMLGYSIDEMSCRSIEWYLSLVHEEDKEQLQEKIGETMSGLKRHFQFEYRMRHVDGHYIWVHDTGKIIKYQEDGTPEMMYGIHLDITASKEEELKQNAILEAVSVSPVVVIMTDKAGNIRYVNNQIETDAGYQPEEVLGENPRIFQSGLHDRKFYLDMWNEIKSAGLWNGVFRNRRKNGQEYYAEATIKEMTGPNGTVIGYVGIMQDITNKIELEKLNEKFDNQLEKLAKQVPGAIYQYHIRCDGTSNFPFASKGIEEIYEISPEEAKRDGSVVFERIHPDDRMEVLQSIYQSASQLVPWAKKYRVILPQRGTRWIKGLANPEKLPDNSVLWHGYIADITSEMELEDKLIQSEEHLRLAIEGADIGLWDWNLENGKTVFSDTWKSMLGYENHEIADEYSSWERLWHPEDEKSIRKAIDDYLEGKQDRYEIIHRLKHKDQSYRWILSRGHFIESRENKKGRFVGIHMDITDRKNSEVKLMETNFKLNEAMKEAQSANTLKSAFLANISHEIRTPINAVLGFSYLLKKEVHTESAVKNVEHIIRSGEHLLNLISDVVDLSIIEAGNVEMNFSSFILNGLLEDVEVINFQDAHKKGLSLSVERVPEEYELIGDILKIKQILINLVNNAVKYTEKGSVHVRTSVQRATEDAFKVVFHVQDTGIGISKKDLAHIFEMFYRNDESRAIKGYGLGLQLSRKYAELLGGKITVASKKFEGSVFSFELPINGRLLESPQAESIVPRNTNSELAWKPKEEHQEHSASLSDNKPYRKQLLSTPSMKDVLRRLKSSIEEGNVTVAERCIFEIKQESHEYGLMLEKLLEEYDYKEILSWMKRQGEKE